YRGAGRPEAAFVLDRLLDRAARRLGLDPADLRRRNLIRKEAMPYRPGHAYRDGVPITYDPADYVAAFDRALALADYERWRAERDRRRGTARPVGVGLSAYLEGTGIGPFEGADVRIDPGGTVLGAVGRSSQGQAPETVTWAFGAHACAVEVDVETGVVRLLRYAAVHDCGRPINPTVVEGQLHGGIVQGLGTALREEVVHDADGQLLTGTLMDYGLPLAADVPPLVVEALDYPSTINELGVKGVGESGIISPSAAIANAVEDALADRGVEITRVPLLPGRVWEALRRR